MWNTLLCLLFHAHLDISNRHMNEIDHCYYIKCKTDHLKIKLLPIVVAKFSSVYLEFS
jgi:hypothetical protein